MNLLPGTTYQALVCLPRFNISTDLPPPPREPVIPECGFCRLCFQTLDVNFEYLTTEAVRLNETHVNYTCEIEVNVEFSIVWFSNNQSLADGDLIDEEPLSIRSEMVLLDGGTDYVVNSMLIAPDALTDTYVRCEAVTAFISESVYLEGKAMQMSCGTLFILLKSSVTEVDLQTTVPFPVWAIAVMVVGPTVIIVILVAIMVACIIKRKRTVKNVQEELR